MIRRYRVQASFVAIMFCLSQGVECKENSLELDASAHAIYDMNDFSGSVFTNEGIDTKNLAYWRRVKGSADLIYKDNLSLETAVEYREQSGDFQVDDFNLNYQVNPHLEITFGKFKEPTGVENQLSLKYQPLLERSVATNSLLFGRNSGLAFDIEFDHWTLDLALTYEKASSSDERDEVARIARFTYAPLAKKKRFVHFGLDYTSRTNPTNEYDIDEPLIAPGVGNLVHSPNFDTKHIRLQGFEFAGRYKSLFLQSEYFEQIVRQSGLSDQKMHGYYGTAVYTFFGRSRTYEHGKIKFRGKKDHTLEMAIRQSEVKLTPVQRGDDATVTSVGLNYFYEKQIRVSLEYEDARLTSTRRNTEQLEGDSLNLRFQLSI